MRSRKWCFFWKSMRRKGRYSSVLGLFYTYSLSLIFFWYLHFMQVIFLKVSKHFATDSEQFEFVQRQASIIGAHQDNYALRVGLCMSHRWQLSFGIWDLDEPRQLGLAGRSLHELLLTIIICLWLGLFAPLLFLEHDLQKLMIIRKIELR